MLIILKKNIDWLKSLILCGFLLCVAHIQGQTVLSGVVLEKSSGKPMPEVICMVSSVADGALLQYGISDKEGKYSLKFFHEADSVLFEVKMLGFKTVVLRIPNRSGKRDIRLEDESINLREVVVKPEDISRHGDTISYNVSSLRSAKDTYISDVIKKLPGVEVNESGKISYMGNPINKFYIEGLDLLGGKYSIASNSIPVDAVESVQILENHQSVKALKDVSFTERAALNLKIKEGKKLHPVGRVSLGAGLDEDEMKYTAEVTNLLLKGESQNLTTLKLNNRGKLLGAELTDHTYWTGSEMNTLSDTPASLVSPSLGYTPPEISDVSVFNDSKLFSFNQLFKLKEESQLRVNAGYLDERKEEYKYEKTIYGYSEDRPLEIVRKQTAGNHTRQGNMAIDWTHNAEKLYVDNRLRVAGEWSDADARLEGTEESDQHFEQPYFLVENKLKVISKWKKDYLTFNSFVRFHRSPQEARFEDETDSAIVQYRSEQLFYSRNEANFSKGIGFSTVSLGAGIKAETNGMNTDMRTVPAFLEDSVVSSRWDYKLSELYLTPSYNYKRTRWAFTLSLPFSWYRLEAENGFGDKRKFHRFSFMPSSRLHWKMHPFWELNVSLGYGKYPSDYRNMNDGYYYVNRSSLRRGSANLEIKEQLRGTLNLSYRNTLDALFSRLTFVYNRQSSNLLTGYDFIGSHVVRTSVPGMHRNSYYSVSANVGKILDAIQTNLNLTSGFSHTAFTQYQDVKVWDVRTNTGYVNFSSSTRITRWWEWAVMWQSIFSHTCGGETLWMHKMQTDMTFSWNKWQCTMRLDASDNQVAPSLHKRAALLSGTLKYKLKKEVQLELTADNLLNTKEYSLRSYSGINQIDELYSLRPRQLMLKLSFQY